MIVFAEVVRRCRRAIVYPAAFSLVLNLLALTIPLYMMQVYDRVLGSRSTDTLLFLTLIGVGALIAFAALDWVRSRMLVRVGNWVERALAPEAFARALEAQLQGYAYRSEAMQDIAQIRGFLSSPSLLCFFDAPWMPIYMLVIFLVHPVLGVTALVGAFTLSGLALLNEFTTRERLKAASWSQITNARGADDALRNAEVIDAMGMFGPIVERWNGHAEQVISDQQVASDRGGVIASASRFVRLALQMGMLGLGAYLVLDHRMTPGGMIAASIILARALAPVEQAILTWRQLIGVRQAYQRLAEFFERSRLRERGTALPAPKGRLDIERVVYAFPKAEHPLLKGISFSLPVGASLALIGASGSGKTTLARILVGVLKPVSGVVRLDGADVFSWLREDFGHHVGYVPQDVELFGGTVRENIARLTDAPAEQVVKAAQLAGCHEMILRLPQGYDTQIGTGGRRLSGGQRQRIALARALFQEPRLVVLDEPNANLDSEGEVALVQSLAYLKRRGATVVVIAHRMSVVQAMDRILVLKEGVIDQYGPRDEVLANLGPAAPIPTAPPRPAFPRVVEAVES